MAIKWTINFESDASSIGELIGQAVPPDALNAVVEKAVHNELATAFHKTDEGKGGSGGSGQNIGSGGPDSCCGGNYTIVGSIVFMFPMFGGPGQGNTGTNTFIGSGGFEMPEQLLSKWCWAAVTISVFQYFHPGRALRQCELAGEVLPAAILGVLRRDCCSNADGCNKPESLSRAFSAANGLLSSGPVRSNIHLESNERVLSFEDIRSRIDQRLPTGVRIGWSGTGQAHFVVLTGYSISHAGLQFVDVADPLYGFSTVTYHAFVHGYRGSGNWINTEFISQL